MRIQEFFCVFMNTNNDEIDEKLTKSKSIIRRRSIQGVYTRKIPMQEFGC